MRTDAGGQRFYTAEDVNMDRVHAAMTDVGRRGSPYPFAWLGVTGHRFIIRSRRQQPPLPGHAYGPHRPEEAPKRKRARELVVVDGRLVVRVMVGWAWRDVLVDEALLAKQREQINRTAYERSRGQ